MKQRLAKTSEVQNKQMSFETLFGEFVKIKREQIHNKKGKTCFIRT